MGVTVSHVLCRLQRRIQYSGTTRDWICSGQAQFNR